MPTVILKDTTHQRIKVRLVNENETIQEYVDRVLTLDLDRVLKSVKATAKSKRKP